jgi:hypothetical protein
MDDQAGQENPAGEDTPSGYFLPELAPDVFHFRKLRHWPSFLGPI